MLLGDSAQAQAQLGFQGAVFNHRGEVPGQFGMHLRQRWRSFLVLGLLNNAIPFTLIFMGETEIGAGGVWVGSAAWAREAAASAGGSGGTV